MASLEQGPQTATDEDEKKMPENTEGDCSRSDLEQGKERCASIDKAGDSNPSFLVIFDQDDSENPKNWSKLMKWGVTSALSASGFNRIMISTMMAPAIKTIAVDLNMTTIESTMALSVYLLATAFGPLIIGPLSELYGRKPLIHATNIWFLLWNLICGFSNSKGLLIASRLLAGFGASAVYTIGYGVLGDLWRPEERGQTLSLYLLIPLCGGASGPIVGGFIVQYSTWRWMFWSTTILQTVVELCSLPIVHETYAPVILQKRAAKLRASTGNSAYHSAIDTQATNQSKAWKLRNSLSRPLRLLVFHPIIQIQAILGGFNYGLLYFALSSFSTLYVTAYSESTSISTLHYIAIVIGEVIGAQCCGPIMDYLYRILSHRAPHAIPELRIPLLLPSAIFTPAGLFLYGWATQKHLHWIVVDVGVALLCLGMQVFDMTLGAYVMDAYPAHVSSASAATQVLRSLCAFGFPLFAERLYVSLGYGWGNGLLGFLYVGIVLPAMGCLWRWGPGLRARNQDSF